MRVCCVLRFHPVFMRVGANPRVEVLAAGGFAMAGLSGIGCTISGQVVVDELHSIDCRAFTGGCFSLTLSARRVKPHSFFDSFQGLPGWW
jgi:hypothetical protein